MGPTRFHALFPAPSSPNILPRFRAPAVTVSQSSLLPMTLREAEALRDLRCFSHDRPGVEFPWPHTQSPRVKIDGAAVRWNRSRPRERPLTPYGRGLKPRWALVCQEEEKAEARRDGRPPDWDSTRPASASRRRVLGAIRAAPLLRPSGSPFPPHGHPGLCPRRDLGPQPRPQGLLRPFSAPGPLHLLVRPRSSQRRRRPQASARAQGLLAARSALGTVTSWRRLSRAWASCSHFPGRCPGAVTGKGRQGHPDAWGRAGRQLHETTHAQRQKARVPCRWIRPAGAPGSRRRALV